MVRCQNCGVTSQILSRDNGYCPECEVEFQYWLEAMGLDVVVGLDDGEEAQ